MRRIARLAIASVILATLCPEPLLAVIDWHTLKTEHFTVFYKDGYENEAWEGLEALERYRPQLESLTGNKVFHLPVVIQDAGAISNGFADPIFKSIDIFTYPPRLGQLGYTQNWWADVSVHEYTHILTLDRVGGVPNGFRFLFGNLFIPNIYLPKWIAEGITVYSESRVSPYQGRLNDGYFEAYMAASAREHRLPSIKKATYTPMEFPLTGSYLYGGEFFEYLSETYGEDKFARFFGSNGSSFFSYFSIAFPIVGIDRAAKKVYGKSFPALWNEWLEYESKRFEETSQEGEQVTHHGWDIKDLLFCSGKLYYTRSYPVKVDVFRELWFYEIVERDTQRGREKTLVSTTSAFTLPMRIADGKLYYAVSEIKRGYPNTIYSTFGFNSAVHEKDLASGKDRLLFVDGVRAFDVLPDGDIIYSKDRPHEFGSEIYLYDRNKGDAELLLCSDYLVGEIAASRRRIVVSARRDWENFNIYSFDPAGKEFEPLFRTPYFAGRIALYGDTLFFTMNIDKIYRSYAYDFESGRLFKITKGVFADYPAYDGGTNSLYFVGLNSYGNDIYRTTADLDEFELPEVALPKSPGRVFDRSEVTRGGYIDNLKSLFPPKGARIPIAYSDGGNKNVGFFFWGRDILGHIPDYRGIITYGINERKPELSLTTNFEMLAPLHTSINFDSMDDNSMSLSLAYPLISKLSQGLTGFFVCSLLRSFDDFERQEVVPYLYTTIDYPRTHLSMYLQMSVERKDFGSSIDRIGLYSTVTLSRYLARGELLLAARGIYDEDNPSTVFYKIRGYDEELAAKVGGMFAAEYSRPVLRFRKGLWNPSVYFEDIIAKIFFDAAVPQAGRSQYSAGLELHLETKALLIFPLDLGVRCSINRERQRALGVFFSLPFR